MTLKVNEIFYSIQGESSYAGLPCVFIRLAGCNLRCTYCDTAYAYEDGESMAIEEIAQAVASYQCRLIAVTGGEPLVQEETPKLIQRLLDNGYRVLLETNGSFDIDIVSSECARIVDVKCPSSGMAEANRLQNMEKLSANDEVKFVIGDRKDFDFAKNVAEAVRALHSEQNVIHFAPVFGRLAPANLAKWILADNLWVRLQLQLHKIIWPATQRGV